MGKAWWLAATLGLAMATGCNAPMERVDPDQDDEVGGTGVDSADIRATADKIARSLLGMERIFANGTPYVVVKPPENQTRFQINASMITDKIVTELMKNAGGRIEFVDRENWEVIMKERQLKRSGAVSVPTDGSGQPNLQAAPLGKPVLYLAAVGLLGYATFKFCSFLFDVENRGTQPKGIAERIGHGASALAHLVLAYTAFQFAQGDKSSATGGSAQESADTVLSVSFGSLVLGLIGVGFLAAAFMQGKTAVTRSFMRELSSRARDGIAVNNSDGMVESRGTGSAVVATEYGMQAGSALTRSVSPATRAIAREAFDTGNPPGKRSCIHDAPIVLRSPSAIRRIRERGVRSGWRPTT